MERGILVTIFILLLSTLSFNVWAVICTPTTNCRPNIEGKVMLTSWPYSGISDATVTFFYKDGSTGDWKNYTTRTDLLGRYDIRYTQINFAGEYSYTATASKSGYQAETISSIMYLCSAGDILITVNFYLTPSSNPGAGGLQELKSNCVCEIKHSCIPIFDGRICDGCNYVKANNEICNDLKDNDCDGEIDEDCEIKLIQKGLLDILNVRASIISCFDGDDDMYYSNCYPYDCDDTNKGVKGC